MSCYRSCDGCAYQPVHLFCRHAQLHIGSVWEHVYVQVLMECLVSKMHGDVTANLKLYRL